MCGEFNWSEVGRFTKGSRAEHKKTTRRDDPVEGYGARDRVSGVGGKQKKNALLPLCCMPVIYASAFSLLTLGLLGIYLLTRLPLPLARIFGQE